MKAEINITGTDAVRRLGSDIAARLCELRSTDKIKTDRYGNVLCDRDKKIVIYPGEGRDKKGVHFYDVVCTVGKNDTILQSFHYSSYADFVTAACETVLPYVGHRVKTESYRKKFRYYGMRESYQLPNGEWKEFSSFRVEGFWRNLINIKTEEKEEIADYKL